ncbi:hypothetical protein OG2516_14331 [Oceanicola granulosus HTCC2516]|uniref:Hemerythrin-like domain-containing protein n=1 Tax=Oceanicola granulosus (strain ATCC BAA-861 / DSM 15982 / KCTC 12143 / HTCC2516) TaxID=314256 RepID=Q2CB11_OCEGH|nr:hemerythrin domain-containing protein [Oceanicola granulosus]EAR49865.1 hypothetical protein OG2516_14331 [Oceanicola granulosus HTCC2516]
MDDDGLDLAAREGLPEALRVLLAAYPREGWAADPNFRGLVEFWLERHMMFREALAAMSADAEQALDGALDPRRFAARLSRTGGMFVQGLHGHHQIEDVHYFPVLQRQDARVASGFDILDRDHHALDDHLASFVEAANGAIRAPESTFRDGAGAFHAELARLTGLLDRHLVDEEELVVPVILKYGSDALPQ